MSEMIDWLAKKVQNFSGETERKELVQQLKDFAFTFKEKVSEALRTLNAAIERFNYKIKGLNDIRSGQVNSNIETLFSFLKKYGNCKPRSAYVPEGQRLTIQFPQQDMERVEDYIDDVDWSKDEVLVTGLCLGPIFTRIATRSQNLSMREQLHEFELQLDAKLQELKGRTFSTKTETNICELYMENVRLITEIIATKILPEIELVDAFFQTTIIKDRVLSDHPLDEFSFSYPIATLIGTPYEKHYQFIKNAFLFYIVSCRIYDTPVLTRLLDHSVLPEDYQHLQKERDLLEQQTQAVTGTMLLPRGGSK